MSWAILLKSFKTFGRILIGNSDWLYNRRNQDNRFNWLNQINLELSRNLELKFDSLNFQYVHNIFCSINMTHKTKNLCEFIENKIFGTITDITYFSRYFFQIKCWNNVLSKRRLWLFWLFKNCSSCPQEKNCSYLNSGKKNLISASAVSSESEPWVEFRVSVKPRISEEII